MCFQKPHFHEDAPKAASRALLLGAAPNSDTKYWHQLGKAIPWLPWGGFGAGGGSPSPSITSVASTLYRVNKERGLLSGVDALFL